MSKLLFAIASQNETISFKEVRALYLAREEERIKKDPYYLCHVIHFGVEAGEFYVATLYEDKEISLVQFATRDLAEASANIAASCTDVLTVKVLET